MTWKNELSQLDFAKVFYPLRRWLLVLGVGLLAILLMILPNTVADFWAAYRLEPVHGKVLHFSIKDVEVYEGGGFGTPEVPHSYLKVDYLVVFWLKEKEYMVGRFSFSHGDVLPKNDKSAAAAINIARSFESNSEIVLWVDPRNPTFSIIFNDYSFSRTLIIFSVIFATSMMMLFAAFLGWRHSR